MKKIRVILLICFFIFTNSMKSKSKEFVKSNNSDKSQNEYEAFSDYRCIYKCRSSENSAKDLKDQYLNLLNNKSEISLNDITQMDVDFYCSNIKPKYIVKLTPDVDSLEEAKSKCSENGGIYEKAVEYCVASKDCVKVSLEIE